MKKIHRFILITFFLLSFNCFSEKDDETLPVKVTIPPFFNLHLNSVAQKMNSENIIMEEIPVKSGSIYYGDLALNPSSANLTQYQTLTHIEMINNSRAFALTIKLYPSEGKKFILDLKNNDNENALKYRTIKTEKTKFPNHILNLGQWTPVPSSGIVTLYDSHGEVVSDSFSVIFSIDPLKKETTSDQYGGGILWSLDSGL